MAASFFRSVIYMLQTTLCYIEKDEKYLMLHRTSKKNDVNKDKWIGVGGKFECGETPEECLCREVSEETGLVLLNYKFRGIMTFMYDDYEPEYIFLYTSDEFAGNLKMCDEGRLEWVDKNKVNSLNLWEGDKLMFEMLNSSSRPFSLKLVYKNNVLTYSQARYMDK